MKGQPPSWLDRRLTTYFRKEKTVTKLNKEKKYRIDTRMMTLARKRKMSINIASWNVRSLYRVGATKKLLSELIRYEIDVTAVQE